MSDSGAGNPAAPGHQAALDGWRGVACLMVFWHHTGTAVELGPVTVRLDTGVQLFFVLSGYLIARPFLAAFASGGPSPSAGEYAAVRAVRILPPYLVALAGFVLARAATGQAVPSGWTVATRALLVSNYFPGENFFAINAVFWTLAIEAQFYALLPLAAWAVGRAVGKTPAGGCVLVALFLAAGPAARAAESWLVGPGALPTGQVRFRSTFAFLDQFGWGMAVALLSATGRRPGTNTLRLGAVAGAALFLAANAYAGLGVPKPDGDWLQSSDWLMVVAYPFALAAGLALVLLRATGGGGDWGGWLAALLSFRPIVAVGTISYSVYLYHIGVQYVLFPRVPLQGVGDFHLRGAISGLLFLAPTLAVAATAYLLVERPCLRWAAAIRRRGKARGRPGSPALSASPRPDSR